METNSRQPGKDLGKTFLLNITYHENYKPFNAGHDIDGQDLFICRTNKFGQIIPGKYSHAIGKCSIARNEKELQFNQFELLIEGSDTKYEWVKLKKPVHNLPDNVLFAGSQSSRITERKLHKRHQHAINHILSSKYSKRKKRRFRRNANYQDGQEKWSRNWRGTIIDEHHQKYHNNKFREVSMISNGKTRCINKTELSTECIDERKLNYFIAKCTLRTGDKISEQIGKIWWKNQIQEWIASFPFGGHEIYCLDYSVLTLRTK